MSDYLQNDYNSFVTHYYEAQQQGWSDETINDVVDDVVDEMAKSYFNAGMYEDADKLLKQVTIKWFPKGSDRNASPKEKVFYKSSDAGAFIDQLRSEGYDMYTGKDFAGSAEVGKYNISNKYDRDNTIRYFKKQALANGTVQTGDWGEKLALLNTVSKDQFSVDTVTYVSSPAEVDTEKMKKAEEEKPTTLITVNDNSGSGGSSRGGKSKTVGTVASSSVKSKKLNIQSKIKSPSIERAKLNTKIIQPIEPFVSSARKSSAGKSVSNAKDRLSYYVNGDTSSKKAESFEDVFKKWWGDA